MTEPIVIKPIAQTVPKIQHFEELWEAAEAVHQPNIGDATVPNIIRELQAKMAVYQAVSEREIDPEEKSKTLNAVFGRVLMALAKLSLKDNINAFVALQSGIEDTKLMHMETQFQQAAPSAPNPKIDAIFEELKGKLSSSGMVGVLDNLAAAMKSSGLPEQ